MRPRSQALEARARVLKKRAAHSHLSILTAVRTVSIPYSYRIPGEEAREDGALPRAILASSLVPFVGAGAVDGWDLGLVQAQVNSQLPTMVSHMSDCAIGNLNVPWPLGKDLRTHLEPPCRHQMFFGCIFESLARVRETLFQLR